MVGTFGSDWRVLPVLTSFHTSLDSECGVLISDRLDGRTTNDRFGEIQTKEATK